MRILDELEREIERVAIVAGDGRGPRRWWRSGAFLVSTPLVVAAVAAAATGAILTGEPVRNPPGLHLNPKAGLGLIAGSGRLLDVRAADPAGGPDWGLRLVRTSRGLGCVQIGRVLDGQLGVLGRDGAFDDDGRFHERGAEIIQQTDCQQTDRAGNVFIAMSYIGLPESADAAACVARPTRRDEPRPVCPPGSLRNVYYGLLGPEATAVTYMNAAGTIVRRRVHGLEGAYLVVVPTDPRRRNVGYFMPGVTPAVGLRSVEYRDGSVCRIVSGRRLGGARHCPLKGYRAPALRSVSRAELAATIHVDIGTRAERPGPKVTRPGFPPIPAQRRIAVRFRARVAADARSYYTISTRMRARGRACGYMQFGPIARDVRAGTVLQRTLWVPFRCHGKLRINVGYVQQRRPTQMPFDTAGFGKANVGRAIVRLP